MKILGLIPARLASKRLPNKPLLKIDGIPLVIHTMKRAMLCKQLDEIIVCTDSDLLISIVNKNGGKAMKTKSSHINGTERIAEIAQKIKKKYELIIDIQCDEVFLNPENLRKLIFFHKKNSTFDIVVPHSVLKEKSCQDVVKILPNNKNEIIYMSRMDIPFNYYNKKIKLLRHLDTISFKPKALIKFSNLKKSKLEKLENIELLRAIENKFKIGTFLINEENFSINTKKDYIFAKKKMKSNKIRKLYN